MPNLACASHKQNKFCSGGPAAPAGAGAAGPALLALAGDTPKPDIGGGPTNTAPGEGGRAKAGKLDWAQRKRGARGVRVGLLINATYYPQQQPWLRESRLG